MGRHRNDAHSGRKTRILAIAAATAVGAGGIASYLNERSSTSDVVGAYVPTALLPATQVEHFAPAAPVQTRSVVVTALAQLSTPTTDTTTVPTSAPTSTLPLPTTPVDAELPPEVTVPAEEVAPPSESRVGNPDGSLLFPGEAPPPFGADPATLQQWWDHHMELKIRWLEGR